MRRTLASSRLTNKNEARTGEVDSLASPVTSLIPAKKNQRFSLPVVVGKFAVKRRGTHVSLRSIVTLSTLCPFSTLKFAALV